MATQHDVDELLRKMEFERGRLDELLASLNETEAEFAPDNVEGEPNGARKSSART